MRDLANKMAELKFEAPLAQFEESDEWGPLDYQSNVNLKTTTISDTINLNIKDTEKNIIVINNEIQQLNDNQMCNKDTTSLHTQQLQQTPPPSSISNNNIAVDNFNEAFTGSLEDLVNTFDEKITKCFGNYEQSVEELAPVQVRSQEEIMNDCQ